MKNKIDILKSIKHSPLFKKMEQLYWLDKKWAEFVERELAEHSHIHCLEKQNLIVYVDHPAVLQMLLMNKKEILARIKYQYPELEIHEIKFFNNK